MAIRAADPQALGVGDQGIDHELGVLFEAHAQPFDAGVNVALSTLAAKLLSLSFFLTLEGVSEWMPSGLTRQQAMTKPVSSSQARAPCRASRRARHPTS